jgi:transposase
MIPVAPDTKVFLAIGDTDMRRGIDSLALLVRGQLQRNPLSGHLFAFCNRRRNALKILFWERNGFWLFQKRLERERFRWPQTAADVAEMSVRELNWLLDGLDPSLLEGHAKLEYSTIL